MSIPFRTLERRSRQSRRSRLASVFRKNRAKRARAIRWLKLAAPWQWPVWLLFGCSWLVVRLPLERQFWLGRNIAKLFFVLVPRRERIIRMNIALAFPELSEEEQELLVKETICSLGTTVIETLYVWMRGVDSLVDRIQIRGLEHLQRAGDDASSGTVILGAHFASLDLVAAALSKKCDFGVTYRKARNPVVDFVCRRARLRYYGNLFEATELRTLAQGLRKGRAVWFASDQDMGIRKSTCFVPFFGIDASTVVTPFRLARKTGARVVFMSHTRNTEDLTWELTLSPVELARDSEPGCFRQDASKVNLLIENVVREAPSQYFWVHRRFKTMANGSRRDYYRS